MPGDRLWRFFSPIRSAPGLPRSAAAGFFANTAIASITIPHWRLEATRAQSPSTFHGMRTIRMEMSMKKICIVGASGKLGQYMIQHALKRGYEVVGVCRERSVGKLDAFKGRITIIPGATNDREVIEKAVAGCDGGARRIGTLGS